MPVPILLSLASPNLARPSLWGFRAGGVICAGRANCYPPFSTETGLGAHVFTCAYEGAVGGLKGCLGPIEDEPPEPGERINLDPLILAEEHGPSAW